MRKIILFLLFSLSTISILAQTPTPSPAPALSGIKANLAAGEVKAISTSDNKITLKTTDGEIDVLLTPTTSYKKVLPEKPSLKDAVETNLSEIGVGDKVVVTGTVSADKKTIPAKTFLLMTKSDLSKKVAAEREMWRTRGISGRVESVDFKTQTITVVSRGMAGETKIAVTPKEAISYRRYSSESVKYADAKESSLAEIKAGDQIRALGDKGADGLTFKAEQILTGSFKTVAGKITAIDLAKNEITIADAQSKKPIVIALNSNSVMKKFPTELAQMMAMRMAGGGQPQGGGQGGTVVSMRPAGTPPTGTTPNNGGVTPPANGQTPPTEGMRPAGGGMRGGRMDLDEMLNNFPTLAIADLKVGDTIGVTSPASSNPNRYTAIKLLAGVEPFLNIPQIPSAGGRGSQSPSFNIPGLEGGFGNP